MITYPKPANTEGNPLTVKHIYNNLGFLTQILNAANDALYYEVEAMNARGQITVESFGNGVESARAYDSAGRLDTLLTSKSGAGYEIQNIDVDFDLIGNLTRRADAAQGFEESFSYDSLNRLAGASAINKVPEGLSINPSGTFIPGALALDSLTGVEGLARARQESGRYWHGW